MTLLAYNGATGAWAATGMIAAVVLLSTTGESADRSGDAADRRPGCDPGASRDEGGDQGCRHVPAVFSPACRFWRWRFFRCCSR